MYVNGKMRLVEKVFQEWGRGVKENGEGVNSIAIYLLSCKNFCKCHNVPPPTTIKKNKLVWHDPY
jgi:hypothetical protein